MKKEKMNLDDLKFVSGGRMIGPKFGIKCASSNCNYICHKYTGLITREIADYYCAQANGDPQSHTCPHCGGTSWIVY